MWADLSNGAMRVSALVVASMLLVSCASAPEGDPEALAEFQKLNDPVELANRAIFEFNRGADRYVIKPVTSGYRAITTPEMRDGVHNALQNLRAPVIFANDILQGQFSRAGTTFARFVINSTLGVVGFGDPAADPKKPVSRTAKVPDEVVDLFALPDGSTLVGSTPAQFRQLIATEAVRWKKLVVDNGIQGEN